LEKAVATASKAGKTVKAVKDFREILADKSIDAVCISTPDHWHAYMSVEACKAGKDVFVEKPASVYAEEGRKMVQAARKYNRVVQAGTMQRSGGYFKKAAEIVKGGLIGEVTFCHTWQAGATKKQGWGKPADGPVPAGLDWDMWLGPAPKVPFNLNRWGVSVTTFPTSISAMGDKLYVDDNVETPDTLMATFRYPNFLLTYESRTANPMPMFGQGAATSIHGTEATLVVNRGGCWLVPNKGSKVEAQTYENDQEMRDLNIPHWKNFIECVKTRAKPTSDIETCVRSSTACILANLSMRHKTWIDWDETNWTVKQNHIKPFLKAKYRAPWKLEV
jgi:predicted dehydrogenase